MKRELLSRETYSRVPVNYSEGMPEDQKDCFIQYLAEQRRENELTRKAMELVLEDFMAKQKELEAKMSVLLSEQKGMRAEREDLRGRLSEERKLRKSVERKAASLQEKLDYANQERFGNKRKNGLSVS